MIWLLTPSAFCGEEFPPSAEVQKHNSIYNERGQDNAIAVGDFYPGSGLHK